MAPHLSIQRMVSKSAVGAKRLGRDESHLCSAVPVRCSRQICMSIDEVGLVKVNLSHVILRQNIKRLVAGAIGRMHEPFRRGAGGEHLPLRQTRSRPIEPRQPSFSLLKAQAKGRRGVRQD